MKTYSPKEHEIQNDWYIIDAEGMILGRLATQIAHRLRGKHKPEFAHHMDMGDFIIVVNADKIRVTGKKLDQKMYYRYSGYPGGLKEANLRTMMQTKPEDVIIKAVKGMIPRNTLSRKVIKKLKVYAGPEHPHEAQQPKVLELSS
jgi:large subunit ribosomal protein L13